MAFYRITVQIIQNLPCILLTYDSILSNYCSFLLTWVVSVDLRVAGYKKSRLDTWPLADYRNLGRSFFPLCLVAWLSVKIISSF